MVNAPAAAVVGLPGGVLEPAVRARLVNADPLGVILFARNIEEPAQVRALIGDVRQALGRPAPVFIDQEGGRVARLRPPHWRDYPAAARLGALFERDRKKARRAAFLQALRIGADLRAVGVDVNCAPVADLREPDGHEVIGDRAFSDDIDAVAELARSMMEGFLASGVVPVIKHVPGHGRAKVDSHEALPEVAEPMEAMMMRDWAPFFALADAPAMMTAHVTYGALDPDAPATLSPRVLGQTVRGMIGFQGVLVSDDIAMGALDGPVRERARAARAAGCDVVLYCGDDPYAMEDVCRGVGPLDAGAESRWTRAVGRPAQGRGDVLGDDVIAEYEAVLADL